VFVSHFVERIAAMPQVNQTVKFTFKDLQDLAIERAKSIVREQTGKDTTGSSSVQFSGHDVEGDKYAVEATVNFQCNGKL
jgi:hypothetical protein